MIEETTKIITELRELVKRNNLKQITDEMLLHEALDLYVSNNISKDKKENIKAMKEQIKQPEMATFKQKSYLKQLRYSGDVNKLTKKEAHQLIKEHTQS